MEEEKKVHYWLHRISHCMEVSYPLLEKGYLSIGYSDFAKYSDDEKFRTEGMLIKTTESKIMSETNFKSMYKKVYGDNNKRQWNLWRFLIEFKDKDIVLVPTPHEFSLYQLDGAPMYAGRVQNGFKDLNKQTISSTDDLLYRDKEVVDIGFVWHVKPIAVNLSRESYAGSKLFSRMKIRQTNADISDLDCEINESKEHGIKERPINNYEECAAVMSKVLLKVIQDYENDGKFEKLIKWYMNKLGATGSIIPPKNATGKIDGADADIISTFEQLNLIVYIQAKKHKGETNKWAVEQITAYTEQEDIKDEYTRVAWVISTAEEFSTDAKDLAAAKHVRLINGLEFSRMLVDIGIEDMNEAFGEKG